MKIYFIRHGESEANKKRVEQNSEGPLSDLGRLQAEYVAKRFKGAPLDTIISSTYERARETAEIINKEVKAEIIYSDLFVERIAPSAFIGKKLNDPDVVKAYETIQKTRQHPGTDNFRFADEENFEEFKMRAVAALEYLSSRKAERVLVVSHGGFLRMIVAVIMFGKMLNYHEFTHVLYSLKTSNTGVTICEYTATGRPQWKIVAWNDHAHLGIRPQKLKFRSDYVKDILSKPLNVTWRLFDEKSIRKGDELVLINSDTDQIFGKAIVTQVHEKKVHMIEQADLPTHELIADRDTILEICRRYYGDRVTHDTLVKVVEFELAK